MDAPTTNGRPAPEIRGISHLVALVLVLMDIEVVSRDAIRALCPTERTRPSPGKITISAQVKGALNRFDGRGWIDRIDTRYVRVLDREGLASWVAQAVDLDDERASTLLNVARAARQLSCQPASRPMEQEIRRQELLALARLMRTAPGAATNERGLVRIVPGGGLAI